MRTFLAIDLPDGLKDQLAARQDDLKIGRHVPPENLHLTLAFLDDQPVAALQELNDALETLRADPFALQIEGFATFGRAAPRVVFADLVDTGPLLDLHRRIRSRCHGAGIVLPRERFRPHVTIARFGTGAGPDETRRLARFLEGNAGFRPWPVPVEEVVLFQSILSGAAPVYEALSRYRLDGRPVYDPD
ncbi:RNA 2',3'-cyclic phosphodiesterase [Pseudooceanicola aestuarii]|uniref:RNA 2',3'-cyclic phosphodiesterase n=1 Tax=Pseudooceanicola aestuarii TaxID=2697319 RepID=UPI0013D888C0|nr:RNA 2',3'-cyclic phosphodiesterase [Pseudooceanicola aestuarii]